MEISPNTYLVLRFFVTLIVFVFSAYIALSFLLIYFGIPTELLFKKLHLKKRYAIIVCLVLLLVNSLIGSWYNGQFNFDPFERKALANYKKKKEEMKHGGHKRGRQLPVDQEEWDDEDWESYYGA